MTKHQQAVNVFDGIYQTGVQAETMSTYELTTAVAELELDGGEHIGSLESAVKSEAIHRLNHPFTWRIQRWFDRIKRA